ncbi:Programmed cell death 1 ligand 1 [Labeo rohita]|uniref:Programmed cell death 1 ligand 1 n=1 Tax=Labeo rohita TaxID=84645 RepID=A0ABQ8MZM3_LABRO|nr:Programmed cell death 1 ligand 1 [Labeo rohita]
MSTPVVVNVGDTANFTCNEACNGNLLWTFHTHNENLEVLECVKETCTKNENFKNRMILKPGALSLALYPVLYNDEGLYTANPVRSNITLPCYARTEKQIADDSVNILWKKDDQIVLQVQKGITTYGSGFRGRALVSLPRYKDGDLSVDILRVTTSDKGLYQCYYSANDEHGYPGGVTLNVTAHQKFCAKKFGENLTLDLFGPEGVNVTFTGHNAAETLVCSVTGNNTMCSSDYNHRVSVINDFLVLRELTSSDTGTFTVRDEMGEVIGVNTVTVEGVTQRHHYIAMSVAIGFVLICLILCCHCHRQSRAQQYLCSYNVIQSTVDINPEPLREPAFIGLSQQETNPETDVCPRTPVEETMPEPERTTEKQDKTEEYIGETI